jgi:hypothetical protein
VFWHLSSLILSTGHFYMALIGHSHVAATAYRHVMSDLRRCRTMCIAMPSNRDLESKGQEKKLFFDLADQLERAQDPEDRERVKEMLVRMTFGEQLPR